MEKAVFLERPNRFVARVLVNGREEIAHVKNTGRCRELLLPGVTVYVQRHRNPARKTPLSLIAVEKGSRLINIDSQAPNAVWAEALAGGLVLPGQTGPATAFRREVTLGESRLDFYGEWGDKRGYMEVKGVTLETEGAVLFPDAPTQRGTRHMEELTRAVSQGWLAVVVFVIQMENVDYFTPNRRMDPAFADALANAARQGVQVMAYDCKVTPDSLTLQAPVPVRL